jgi:hypothetical protein
MAKNEWTYHFVNFAKSENETTMRIRHIKSYYNIRHLGLVQVSV